MRTHPGMGLRMHQDVTKQEKTFCEGLREGGECEGHPKVGQ